MMMDLRLTLLTLLTGLVVCQGDISHQLVDAMNAARAKSGLPKIEYSSKLSKVAQTHCDNMSSYSPNTSDIHSWFGPLACDFNSNPDCMWSKAKSVGGYAGKGYEISLKGSVSNVDSMISGWLGSSAHKDVILNQGTWAQMKWNAVGGGQKGEFATMWFGAEKDDSSPSDSNQQSKPENNQQQQQAPGNNQQQQNPSNEQPQGMPNSNQPQGMPNNNQPQGMPNNNRPQETPSKGDSNGFQPMPNQPNRESFKPIFDNVQNNNEYKPIRPNSNKRPISIPNFDQNQNGNSNMRPISIPNVNQSGNMNWFPQQSMPSSQQSWSPDQNSMPGSQQGWFNFP